MRSYAFEVELRQGHRLVTGGPYAFARHPQYAGLLLLSVAVQLTSGMVRLLPSLSNLLRLAASGVAPGRRLPRRARRAPALAQADERLKLQRRLSQTWLFGTLLLHWAYVVARIPREEQMMLRAFGCAPALLAAT